MERFGLVVKEARKSKGWSLNMAAKKLGTFKGYVCGIETGSMRPPSPKLIRKMAKKYELDAGCLLALAAIEKLPRGVDLPRLHFLLGHVVAEKAAAASPEKKAV